jgi:hypothetical protein
VLAVACSAGTPAIAAAQTFSYRGFVDLRALVFPQDSPHDDTNFVGDMLARGEAFYRPTSWAQFAFGLDARANSDDQVDTSFQVDLRDRLALRPSFSVRRLSATFTRGPLTLDAGKQFIRWGKTDVITPTDRFAPKDFLYVIDGEFLPVTGVRTVLQWGANTIDVPFVPRFTPDRTPLLDQRWTLLPGDVTGVKVTAAAANLPSDSQAGVRWSHTGSYEYSLSFFDGLDYRPNLQIAVQPEVPSIEIAKEYPHIRSYGADGAVPTRWFTIKGEAAYVTSSTPHTDEYVLYVVQLERQTGEWVFVGGYAGELVTVSRGQVAFAPDRGLARALVGRASYTIDTNRRVAFESAVRQNGRGVYVNAEYSHARGQHWRATVNAAVIGGSGDDFLGRYRQNSYGALALRYSF